MISVSLFGKRAIWNARLLRWVSTDAETAGLLNLSVSDEALRVDTAFREGGIDKVVLRDAQERFGTDLEVINYRDPAVPLERKNEVV